MELQRRQQEFAERGAILVVIGSEPEPLAVAAREAERRGISYPLLYDADRAVTKRLGLWSERMEMPWMGYVIVDRSGEIVSGSQILSEQPDAAPRSVDQILEALDRARAE